MCLHVGRHILGAYIESGHQKEMPRRKPNELMECMS